MDVHYISGGIDMIDFLDSLSSYTTCGRSTAYHCYRHTIVTGESLSILHGRKI